MPTAESENASSLRGQVVLITGGRRGIGFAIATACGAQGARVALMGRGSSFAAVARLTAAGVEAMAVRGNVADSADARRAMEAVVSSFGRLDVLVNNAAVLHRAPLRETTDQQIAETLDVNVRGVLNMTRAASDVMIPQRSGVIINIGSDLALRGRADYVAYCASKGAVLQITRATAIELGAFGIRVVMLSPAATNTEMAAPSLADPVTRQALYDMGTLGRINEPEDVAAAAAFLASPSARTVTGCNWPVDAGVLAR